MIENLDSLNKKFADMKVRHNREREHMEKQIAQEKERQKRDREREKAKKEKEKTSYDYYVEESKNYKDPLPERKMTLRELINELKKLLKEVEY
ncbi:MAG: hypothetical protein IJ003_00170 [Candidatus Gastranaerophilales bacterium]|nr:hypothetical protein [Candidatus Gastranaerophilales bacterium]